ncbi:MAG: hypothetical protein CMP08_04455 [Xanthomonadales bacterium]|nr:hypothetical protein [Xanthomonadales bacterium]|tara:strand:+ start:247 stop:2181 length:1935 start_codon:yes stop_codon:yes gene_type:complete
MLQKIRDGASGPLAYIVVGIIAVVFGVWGIGSYFTPSSDPAVATAGDTQITQSELQRAFDQRYQQLRQAMGDSFNTSVFPPGEVRRSVLQRLIDQAVVTQYASENGYRVTDADLLTYIRNNPQFQVNGSFSAERYKQLLAASGIQPSQYEARLRRALLGDQVRQVMTLGAFAVGPEVDQAFAQAHTEREVSLLRFEPAAYRQNVEISDAAVSDYYQAHKDEFMQPERVKVSYVSLDANTLDTGGEPDTAKLRQIYDAQQQAFGTPETRSAGILRVDIDDTAGPSAARETVSQLADKLTDNKSTDLSALADDTAGVTYRQVTDQARADLPSAVADTLFSMDKGAVSHPIKTDSAWYLVRMTGKQAAQRPAFDDPDVQARLKAMARADQRDEAFAEKSDTLQDLAYQAPNDLNTISETLSLQPQTSQWITADGGPGIGQYDAVRNAAFSDAVLEDGLNSKVLKLGQQREVVLRVAEHDAAAPKPLAAVADTIRKRLKTEAAADKAAKAADRALAALRSGQSIQQVADTTDNARLQRLGYVGRNGDNALDRSLRKAVFAIALEGQDRAARGSGVARTDDGMPVVITISGQRLNASQGTSENKRKAEIADQQRQYNASLEYAAFDRYLNEQAEIEIEKDSLKAPETSS